MQTEFGCYIHLQSICSFIRISLFLLIAHCLVLLCLVWSPVTFESAPSPHFGPIISSAAECDLLLDDQGVSGHEKTRGE